MGKVKKQQMKFGEVESVAVECDLLRYVVSWVLSNTLDAFFWVDMLEKAFKVNRPEIFNSGHISRLET